MIKIEKYYRSIGLGERARQLEGEVLALAEILPTAGSHRLHLAQVFFAKAAAELEAYASMGLDLETLLRLSIASVKDRKSCERIAEEQDTNGQSELSPPGAQTLTQKLTSQTETASALTPTVSSFDRFINDRNRSTYLQNGE
jgi:hypothetical protein